MEAADCGMEMDVYSGDAYLLENFGGQCSWQLSVHPDVNLDLLCSFLYVPCSQSSSLDFAYSFPGGSVLAEDSFCHNNFFSDVTLR